MSWKAELPLCGHGVGAAEQGAHAREQRLHGERLGDVVVRAGVQAAHGILILGARGHHDDRQIARGGAAADLAADFEAGHRRQHPVEQHEVGLGFGDAGQRFLAVGGFLDAEALLFEIVAQHGGERGFVLHHQHQRFGQAGYAVGHLDPLYSRGRTTA